jgi:hypothetical protein
VTWNYRIVRYADGTGYGLHEVYYDKDGKEYSMTKEPCSFVAETDEELIKSLCMAYADTARRPVFEEPKEWQ